MKKILFLFNQMLGPTFATGGDVLGKEMLEFARKDDAFECSVSAPFLAKNCFESVEVLIVGDSDLEKSIFDFHKVYTYPVAYFIRTLDFIRKYRQLEVDIVYSTGDFFCNVVPAYYLRRRAENVRWAASVYHVNEPPFSRNNPVIRGFVSYFLQRFSFFLIKRKADVIFVLTELIRDDLRELGFNNEIAVSGAGLHVKDMEKNISKIKARRQNDIVFFNRINHTKGIFDLPEIFSSVLKSFPRTRMHIIGGGSSETINNLKKEFENRGCLDKVVYYGYIEEKREIYKILKSCKVFIQPSYEEGWSIVLHEGIICGCVPVVYDLPIYKEIFNELLDTASIGNKNQFSELVVNNLKLSSKECEKKHKPILKVTKRFTWSNVYLKQRESFEKFLQ